MLGPSSSCSTRDGNCFGGCFLLICVARLPAYCASVPTVPINRSLIPCAAQRQRVNQPTSGLSDSTRPSPKLQAGPFFAVTLSAISWQRPPIYLLIDWGPGDFGFDRFSVWCLLPGGPARTHVFLYRFRIEKLYLLTYVSHHTHTRLKAMGTCTPRLSTYGKENNYDRGGEACARMHEVVQEQRLEKQM